MLYRMLTRRIFIHTIKDVVSTKKTELDDAEFADEVRTAGLANEEF